MKTIVLNKMFYVKPSTRADGMFDVWKNNGADAPDQLVGTPFASPGDADAFARKLEAKAKAAASDNRSMNNATDILASYLADNPELVQRLLDAAVKHDAIKRKAEAEKAEREAKKRKLAETCSQADAVSREIAAVQAEINKLKGRVLSLQKARKALVREAVSLSNELRALGAL